MKYLFALVCILIGLSSCAVQAPSLYSWYDYESAAYQNSKHKTDKSEAQLIQIYQKMGASQRGLRKTVPPGYYAEYGYELYKSGRQEEALKMLEKEIELYPESKSLISRLINQIKK